MKEQPFDDETLMAFADGELDAATSAAVEEAIDRDDEIMARVAMFMETRARAKSDMASLLDEPVPAELERSVRGMVEKSRKAAEADDGVVPETVVPFERTPRQAPKWPVRAWALPLAASLAVAIATGLIGYELGNSGGQEGLSLAGAPGGDVVAALQAVPSGDERQLGGQRIRMVASFRDQDGIFCREYEIDPPQGSSLVSVSCVEGGEWATRIAIAAPLGGDGYAPASSMDALEAYMSAINAGPALSQEEEAEVLADLP